MTLKTEHKFPSNFARSYISECLTSKPAVCYHYKIVCMDTHTTL